MNATSLNQSAIQRWRRRFFTARETVRSCLAFPGGKRIHFSPWPDVEGDIRRGFRFTAHTISFGEIPAGGGNFDLVVPMSVEALVTTAGDQLLRARNPLPLPSPEAVDLCDNKAALNERLRALGFAQHVPADASAGKFPYILKRHRDAFARHAYRIDGPADEATYAEQLASPDYLKQEWVDGDTEEAVHLLLVGGRVRRELSVRYQMRDHRSIRGRDPVVKFERCRSRHVALFEAMLNAIGFEGLCCLNCKLRDGIPQVLEINPRFGRSLAPYFATFLRSLDWKRTKLARRTWATFAAAVALFAAGLAEAGANGPAPVAAAAQTSESCRACHEKVFTAWSGTDHALANRPVDRVRDAAALGKFAPPAGVGPGTAPEMVLGNKPLWQPLLLAPGGRWQPHELAFDPAKQEWFNVFGAEARRPGEWGHWTGRGMSWNSMCAQCHMTGYQKNYEAATDSYRSAWIEHGVGCVQCHGPTKLGHGAPDAAKEKSPAPFRGDRAKMMQTCAPCHARNEPLTANFRPGDNYADHYRVALPVEPGVFYPDGQQRDEDFNWTSVLLSRMGRAGVTCLDCHDPHTTKTILPTAKNELCLQCHAAPGRVQPNGTRAVVIDPVAHSHHGEGSAGNSCIACHMPTTTYMQRAPRHDHGWLKPDPLLTKELGIPNACNRCHADKPAEWASAVTDKWYGAKMESRQRARARALAVAQAGRPEATDALLALLRNEDIPAWRATYLGLLAANGDNAAVQAEAMKSLRAADAIERAAAVQLVASRRDAGAALAPVLKDPVRLVRLDAEWALSPTLADGSPARKELDAYLALSLDQPAGRLRIGQDLANRGQLDAAEKEIAQAAAWDPLSAGILDAHGLVLAGLGRTAEAAEKFSRAAELAPADATLALRAALAFAEAGRPRDAEKMCRLAVARDPKFGRAWYNLGLLLAQKEQLGEAAEALRRAEAGSPDVADYPYALATVLLRAGDRAGARAAAERALALVPEHAGARELLRSLR